MEQISDEMLAKEMKILWQYSNSETRDNLHKIIYEYFEGNRAERIQNKLQETIEKE